MIGTQIGSYRIVKQLGEGGMGAVYVGEHVAIGRRVAIKVLLPQISSQPEMVRRFFNEARIKTMVDHPGLVDVFDYGQLPNGSAYLVMELLSGESLTARNERERPMSLEVILTIGRQMCSALAAAHGHNVIHRDLKPDNIFLTKDEDLPFGIRVKILDFGIAKLTGDPAAGVHTQTSMIFGTPAYMAPEQCRGAANVDPRSDVYAIGCILYEMATGRTPFSGELLELLMKHVSEPPTPPRAVVPTVAPPLEALILRALAKNPADRQQSMQQMIAELDAIGRPSAQMPVVTPTPPYGMAAADLKTLTPKPNPNPNPSPSPSPSPNLALSATLSATPTPSPTTAQLPVGERPRQTEVVPPPSHAPSRGAPIVAGVVGVVVLSVGAFFGWRHFATPAAVPTPAPAPTPTPAPAPAPLPAAPAPPALPANLVHVAGGKLSIGRDDYGKPNRLDVPAHPVEVNAFALEKTEVAGSAYRDFVDAGLAKAPWPKKVKDPDEFFSRPVVAVGYADAVRYCQWRYPGKGRLPTEAEWERAARGATRRLYPWGNEPNADCVTMGKGPGGTPSPTGSLPCGATPEGIVDLSGNVWEWTSTVAVPYPGSSLASPPGDTWKVIRGGSFFNQDWDDVTTTVRQFAAQPNPYLGFRCAVDL